MIGAVIDYVAFTGKIVEYDEPLQLMNKEGSLFGQLVKEYWSHSASGNIHSENC
jgi:ATP-binding cassette subfamily C (CFTR/MRP) protein 2